MGRVLMQVQTEAFRGPRVEYVLHHLLRHIAGRLLMIWDGSSIHRAKVVKVFLAEGGNSLCRMASGLNYTLPDDQPRPNV